MNVFFFDFDFSIPNSLRTPSSEHDTAAHDVPPSRATIRVTPPTCLSLNAAVAVTCFRDDAVCTPTSPLAYPAKKQHVCASSSSPQAGTAVSAVTHPPPTVEFAHPSSMHGSSFTLNGSKMCTAFPADIAAVGGTCDGVRAKQTSVVAADDVCVAAAS